MNFDLSEDQEMFRATAARFVAPIDGEARRRLRSSDTGYDRARWSELAELGLIALAAPEECGGMGGSMIDLTVVAEALGRGIAPDPWLENGVLPALLLAAAGDQDTLAGVLDGSTFAAFAFAERGQRYNLAARAMTAEGSDGDYRLSGEKTFVPGALLADLFLVTAEHAGEQLLFAVPADAAGLEVRSYAVVDGSLAAELHLRGVKAGKTLRIPAEAFAAVVAQVRLLAAAEMVGLAQRLLDDTLGYVKQREQFGVAIGSFQALQHRLVECYSALEQSRSMLLRVALAPRSDQPRWSAQAAGAKAFIGENALRIGREAVQMHGGMGVTDELAIGNAFKRILLLERLLGGRAEDLAHYAKAA
ncbi:MAG: acyl-CoA dehydrogenase family protein [Tsuneonella sp.]